MGWIRCVRCKKLQRDFMGRTFVLIAPVQYVLHQLSCTYETIPNALKYYEMHQNISIGSNGVDWLRSLHKIPRDFVSRTFVLTAPVRYVLHQVSCSYETIRNALKYCETDRNISLASNIGCVRCEKSRYDFAAPTFALIAPVHPVLHRVSCCYKTIPNALKHYEMH